MALHFLEHGFALPDLDHPGLTHGLELYEAGGERFLRVWVGGGKPGAQILCRLTRAQALALAEAAEGLAQRITD
jgi:hypothetical protein